MIFYFSGTGNSLWVARRLSKVFNEPLVSISDSINCGKTEFILKQNERIFFVYPVHSWGPAILVGRFISTMNLKNYTEQKIYSISTCGNDCGYTYKIIRKWLSAKGLSLTAYFSLIMPNTYVLMPGFGTDPKELAQSKLDNAPATMDRIVAAINSDKTPKDLYNISTIPAIKSNIIYPAFIQKVKRTPPFHTNNNCISCALCEKICPTLNIKMVKGLPTWSNRCVECTACINRCPERAIEYGRITQKKGRYHHPEV